MLNIKKWKIWSFLVGLILAISAITLIVICQNSHSSNEKFIKILLFLHNKVILDYLLLIIGVVLMSVPVLHKFFQSSNQLSNISEKSKFESEKQ